MEAAPPAGPSAPPCQPAAAWGRAVAQAFLSRGLGDARLAGLDAADAGTPLLAALVQRCVTARGDEAVPSDAPAVIAKSAMSTAEQRRLGKLCDGPRLSDAASCLESEARSCLGVGSSITAPGGEADSASAASSRPLRLRLGSLAIAAEITSCAGRTAEALVDVTHEYTLEEGDDASAAYHTEAGVVVTARRSSDGVAVAASALARLVEAGDAEASHRRAGVDAISYSSGGYCLTHLLRMSLEVSTGSEDSSKRVWDVQGSAGGSGGLHWLHEGASSGGSSKSSSGAGALATASATLTSSSSSPLRVSLTRSYLMCVHSDGHMLPFSMALPTEPGVAISFSLRVPAITGPGAWVDVVCPTHEGVACSGLGGQELQVRWAGLSAPTTPNLLLVLEPSNTTWLWQSLRLPSNTSVSSSSPRPTPLPSGLASIHKAVSNAVTAANWAGRSVTDVLQTLDGLYATWSQGDSVASVSPSSTAQPPSATPSPPLAIPSHIAIVMDGNGRWAKQRGLNRSEGHKAGVDAIHRVIRACRRLGVRFLTLYAFSHQNWSRPPEEVQTLMRLLMEFVRTDCEELIANGVRLLVTGDISRLPAPARRGLKRLMDVSASNTALTLILALSYGGREEILRAVKDVAHAAAAGEVPDVETLDCSAFRQRFLPNPDVPDPDLLVRTSGELRVSNFLLWHIAYTEIWVSEQLWPDFDDESLVDAIRSYSKRERRFGLTSEQLAATPGASSGTASAASPAASVSYGVTAAADDESSNSDGEDDESGDPLDWAGRKDGRHPSKRAPLVRRSPPSALAAVSAALSRCARTRVNTFVEAVSSGLYTLMAGSLTSKALTPQRAAQLAGFDGAGSDEDPASVTSEASAGDSSPRDRARSRSSSGSASSAGNARGAGWSTLALLLWVCAAFVTGILLPRSGEPNAPPTLDGSGLSSSSSAYLATSASASCTAGEGTCSVPLAAAAADGAAAPSCPPGCRCWCARSGTEAALGTSSSGRNWPPASSSPPRPSPAPPPSKAARPLVDSSGRATLSGSDGSWLRSLWQRLKARGAAWGLLSGSGNAGRDGPKAAWGDAVWIEGSPDPETGNTWGWVEVTAPAAAPPAPGGSGASSGPATPQQPAAAAPGVAARA